MRSTYSPSFPDVRILTACLSLAVSGAIESAVAADPAVSWFRDVTPLFKRSCNGCHNPNKLKGGVDTSTYAGFLKPGKHGPNFLAGDPAKSRILEEITGKEPSMPKEGDALTAAEASLIARWIREGAKDDTPENAYSTRLKEPPIYGAPPVITSLAYSPDGRWFAISGYHEVLLHSTAELRLKARLVGESPRIESMAFSPDSHWLAVSGGAPARFGELQIWDPATGGLTNGFKIGADCVFGVSWSPDSQRLAFGGADKSVRVIAAVDGKELMKFDNHSDWVFRTAWMDDGKRILSGSRDRAMKLINTANGQFIDDINKLLEPVVSMARHPKEEWAAYGGAEGGLRVYRMKENQERTAGNNDVNLVREFERQKGTAHSVAWSADGSLLAVGGTGEVRVYQSSDGKRSATLKGHSGAIFALAFSPDGKQLATGGFDGLIRVFDPATGEMLAVFTPVPAGASRQVAAQ